MTNKSLLFSIHKHSWSFYIFLSIEALDAIETLDIVETLEVGVDAVEIIEALDAIEARNLFIF